MKQQHWFVLCLAGVVLGGVNCGQGVNRSRLLGSWRLDTTGDVSVVVRFVEDSSYSMLIQRPDGQSIHKSGTWVLDQTRLTQTEGAGRSETVEIDLLDKSRLIIVAPDASVRQFARVTDVGAVGADREK